MTEEMELIIESYYEDSIELPDNKLLLFQRITDYRRTERNAVKVSIEDLETQSIIELGIYFDATWKFVSPMNESLFWQTFKANQEAAIKIFNRLRMPVPAVRELHAYRIKFSQLSSRVSSKLDKLTQIFREN